MTADIKDLDTERKRRQDDKDIDYREKIRAHKLSVFIRTTLALAVFIIIIIVANNVWKDRNLSKVTVQTSVPVSLVTGTTARNLAGSLFIYSKDGASCVDEKGKAIWNESFEMQSPLVSICEGCVAIGDYNGREIYVANNKQILGTIRTTLPIRSVSVSGNGVVAAVLDDSDVIRIYVYDGNTDTSEPIVQAKATMNKSGYPIGVSLSPNGKLMMVSYFFVDSGSMKSSVSFYNFGEVGSNKVDNFVSGFDYADTVLPYVQFLNNDAAFGLSNERAVFFSGSEVPDNVGIAMFSGKAVSTFHNNEYVGIMYPNTTGDGLYRLETYDAKGNKLSEIPVNFDYTDVLYNNDQVVIYGGNDCMIYTVRGTERYNGKLESNINLLVPTTSQYKYQVITSDAMETVLFE